MKNECSCYVDQHDVRENDVVDDDGNLISRGRLISSAGTSHVCDYCIKQNKKKESSRSRKTPTRNP